MMVHEELKGQDWIDAKRRARMARVDAIAPEMRDLVNEYGFSVVDAMTSCGVAKPRHIRHLVETVLNEFSPTRGSFSAQGPKRWKTTGDPL